MKPSLKKMNNRYNIHTALDIVLLLFSFQLAYSLQFGLNKLFFGMDKEYLGLFCIVMPSWILAFHISKVALIPRTSQFNRLLFEVSQLSILNLIIFVMFPFFIRYETISFHFMLLFAGLSFVSILGVRIVEYNIFKRNRVYGSNHINIIIVADGSSEAFIEKLLENKQLGYRVLFIISNCEQIKSRFGNCVKVYSEKTIHVIENLIDFDIIDEIIYYKQRLEPHIIRPLLRTCEEVGVILRVKTVNSEDMITNARISKISNESFLTFAIPSTDSIAMSWKSFFDVFAAFFLILAFMPFFLSIAFWVKLTSPGPVFFKQLRVGQRNRQFYLYKFRTMVVNAEALRVDLEAENEMDGPVFKIRNDPRVTSIGRYLRKTGLDELPQLFNVLKGEMSLIGPRPPLKSEIRKYKRWQLRRLAIKPGITCSWQIIPDRNSVKFDKWMKLDLAYIDNWSLRQDLVLLVKTVRTVLFGTGA